MVDFIDYNGVNRTIKEFDTRHGDFVKIDEWLLFEDGARREFNIMGRLMEPPRDDYKRAKLICTFHQAKLNLAVQQFNTFKQNVRIGIQNNLNQKFTPPAPNVATLRRGRVLRGDVRRAKKKLAEAENYYESVIPENVKQRAKDIAKNQSDNRSFLADLDDIEV